MPEKQKKKSKPVAHYYAFALTWLLFAVLGIPIHDFGDVLAVFLSALVAGVVTRLVSTIISKMRNKKEVAQDTDVITFSATGNAEIDVVIKEGVAQLNELRNSSYRIKNPDVKKEAIEMADISNKIIEKLKRKPELLSSVRRFFNYYLPTTVKLVTNYRNMESQGVSGENIGGAMEKIENSMATLVEAYRTQLDSMFSHTAVDLESDVDVLEHILKQQGLVETKEDAGIRSGIKGGADATVASDFKGGYDVTELHFNESLISEPVAEKRS